MVLCHDDRTIIQNRMDGSCMVRMIHLLGMEMIAEGVETAEQAEFLKDNGCFEMQGYYFFKPMAVEEFYV